MQIPLVVFPITSLVVIAIVCVAFVQRRSATGGYFAPSTWLWITPHLLLLLFLYVWSGKEMVECTPDSTALPRAYGLITAAALLPLARHSLWARYDRCPKPLKVIFCAFLCAMVLLLSVAALEYPFSVSKPFVFPTHALLEALLMALVYCALYFLAQRHAAGCAIGVAAFAFLGIAQYFIKRFKNAAILPTDLLAIGTAAAVSNEYVFVLDERAIFGLSCASLAIGALSLFRAPGRKQVGTKLQAVATNLACGAASLGLLGALVLVPNYMTNFGVQMQYWYTMDYYQLQGFLPTFIAVLQDMDIHKPEGYTDEKASSLLHAYAESYRRASESDDGTLSVASQFAEQKPSIVVVMNESFSDLSVFDGMHAGYTGPQFFLHGLDNALSRGSLYVSVHGGGTCNSEFEFLTGNSMQFIGTQKYPYSVYDLSRVDALAAEFKALGYRTTALHPNYPTNWNRDELYPQMGFDQFLSIDDFGGIPDCSVDKVTPNDPHCEVFHSGVSDKATYDRALQLLDEDETPQLIFDVTMANHGSYDQNNIDAAYVSHYVPSDYAGEVTPSQLNEYLACIKRSDEDLREFVDKLRELERPIVLVFFGDHQPKLTTSYLKAWYSNDPVEEYVRKLYSACYLVWANYDIASNRQANTVHDTSVDLLASQILDTIGAPVSDYQAALLEIQKQIPSLSASGYQGADGTWYTPDDDGPYAQAYRDLQFIEYLNFATKV